MGIQKIIDYVMHTPYNTNPAILKQVINDNISWNDLKDKPFYETDDGEVVKLDAKYLPDDIGGAEPDMVLTLNVSGDATPTATDIVVTSGSASNVLDAVRAGRQPSVKVYVRSGANDDYSPLRGEVDAYFVSLYGESVLVYFTAFSIQGGFYAYMVSIDDGDVISSLSVDIL